MRRLQKVIMDEVIEMAEKNKWIAVEKVRKNLLEILDSLDERIKESEEILFFFPDDDYHEGRKESLELTQQQIHRLFAEVLV
jgi:molecular chaperone GrpE (heat shock protein)